MTAGVLEKCPIPKGTLFAPVRQAIVAFIRKNGASTPTQLVAELLALHLVTADDLAAKPHWLQGVLGKLKEAKHIVPVLDGGQAVVWVLAPEPVKDPMQVASPRRHDVMFGKPYKPRFSAPARAGAMDFARADSVIGSRHVPFRSSL